MAMAALSCIGLPVASSLSADSTSTSSSSAPRDGKSSNGVSRAAMEPTCVGCLQTCRSSVGARNWLGLGRTTGLSDGNYMKISSYRNEDKSRRRLEIVQQAAPPTLSFPERNSLKNLDTGAVLDVSGTKSLPNLLLEWPDTSFVWILHHVISLCQEIWCVIYVPVDDRGL